MKTNGVFLSIVIDYYQALTKNYGFSPVGVFIAEIAQLGER